jgi:hypothetical protein
MVIRIGCSEEGTLTPLSLEFSVARIDSYGCALSGLIPSNLTACSTGEYDHFAFAFNNN